MKLEIKHLSAYLPFQPNVLHLERNIALKVTGIYKKYNTDEHFDILLLNWDLILKSTEIKPILRPLSDLTKTINWGIQSYEFTSLFEIGDTDGFIYEFSHGNIKLLKDLSSIARHNSHNDINYLPYPVVKMMFEYHFDIFGLIESGVAININSLDN